MKEITITKEEQKAIKEMLNGCEGYIVLSNKGSAVNCSTPMLMTLITNLLEDLYKKNKINDILLDEMIKIVKRPDDIDKMILEKLKYILEKMEGGEDNGK